MTRLRLMISHQTPLQSFQSPLSLGRFPPLQAQQGSSSESKENSEFGRISAQPSLVPAPRPRSGGSGLGSPTQPCEPAYSSPVLSQQTRAVSLNKAGPPVPGHSSSAAVPWCQGQAGGCSPAPRVLQGILICSLSLSSKPFSKGLKGCFSCRRACDYSSGRNSLTAQGCQSSH